MDLVEENTLIFSLSAVRAPYVEDMYSGECYDLLAREAAAHKRSVIVGVHLCGDLARRAIEMWLSAGIRSIVLSPCCLVREVGERKRPCGTFGYGVAKKAKNLGVDAYKLWCLMLYHYIPGLHKGEHGPHTASCGDSVIRKDLGWDDDMVSDRNAFVTASVCGPCAAGKAGAVPSAETPAVAGVTVGCSLEAGADAVARRREERNRQQMERRRRARENAPPAGGDEAAVQTEGAGAEGEAEPSSEA